MRNFGVSRKESIGFQEIEAVDFTWFEPPADRTKGTRNSDYEVAQFW